MLREQASMNPLRCKQTCTSAEWNTKCKWGRTAQMDCLFIHFDECYAEFISQHAWGIHHANVLWFCVYFSNI